MYIAYRARRRQQQGAQIAHTLQFVQIKRRKNIIYMQMHSVMVCETRYFIICMPERCFSFIVDLFLPLHILCSCIDGILLE